MLKLTVCAYTMEVYTSLFFPDFDEDLLVELFRANVITESQKQEIHVRDTCYYHYLTLGGSVHVASRSQLCWYYLCS